MCLPKILDSKFFIQQTRVSQFNIFNAQLCHVFFEQSFVKQRSQVLLLLLTFYNNVSQEITVSVLLLNVYVIILLLF